MLYKSGPNVGIRQKFDGKKQIFSFGGRAMRGRVPELRRLADRVLQKLDTGMTWSKAKSFAQREVEVLTTG